MELLSFGRNVWRGGRVSDGLCNCIRTDLCLMAGVTCATLMTSASLERRNSSNAVASCWSVPSWRQNRAVRSCAGSWTLSWTSRRRAPIDDVLGTSSPSSWRMYSSAFAHIHPLKTVRTANWNWTETVSKQFWNCSETVSFQFHFVVRTV